MNLKLSVAVFIAVLVLLPASASPRTVVASTPPGEDHAWNVTVAPTADGSHPDVTMVLNLCTDGSGQAGSNHECASSVPSQPVPGELTFKMFGITPNEAVPLGDDLASLSIDGDTGASCSGSHTSAGPVELTAAKKTGIVGVDIPASYVIFLTLRGIPTAAVMQRGVGTLGSDDVMMLVVARGGMPGTDAVEIYLVLGGGVSHFCQPSTVTLAFHGVSGAENVLTLCGACTNGHEVDLLISTGSDDDGDGFPNGVDDCPTVDGASSNPRPHGDSQISYDGIGVACANGEGYDNVDPAAVDKLASTGPLGCQTSTSNPGCGDIDSDGVPNAMDNCPFTANPANPGQENVDQDGRGDACEIGPAITTKGDGIAPYSPDFDDRCNATFSVGGSSTASTTCLSFRSFDSPPGPAYVWQDSNGDGWPDFLIPAFQGDPRDHKADSNADGYSDADEGTPANCGVVSCSSVLTLGTSETGSCQNPGRNCGSPPASNWVPLSLARTTAGGTGSGCWTMLDTVGLKKTTKLTQSDVDLDGTVSILDLSKIASWFGNAVGDSHDPRWEGNFDGDGTISILDLSAAAANFGRSESLNCKVE